MIRNRRNSPLPEMPRATAILALLATSALALSPGSLDAIPGEGDEPRIEECFLEVAPGIRLFYRKAGSGPDAVVVPGGYMLWKDFLPLARDRTVVFYDMRNRGRSSAVEDGDRLTLAGDVADLEAVRRHFGFEGFSVIGYSYLGKMAALYALQHPARLERIVQIGPVPMRFGTEYPEELTGGDPNAVLDPDALAKVRHLRQQGFHETHPEEYCREEWKVTRVRLVGDSAFVSALDWRNPCEMPNEWPTRLAKHMEHHFASMRAADLSEEEVRKIDVPVLTIHGTADRNAPYGSGREWVAALPDARLLTVPGAAHAAWLSDLPVIEAIDTFLEGEWPEEASVVGREGPG